MSPDLSKVVARSASKRTDDWPVWMLWNGIQNVTAEVMDLLGLPRKPGQVFVSREYAKEIAELCSKKARGITDFKTRTEQLWADYIAAIVQDLEAAGCVVQTILFETPGCSNLIIAKKDGKETALDVRMPHGYRVEPNELAQNMLEDLT